jgi:SAM-dependent methyltransferase
MEGHMGNVREVAACEVCGSGQLASVLNLGPHPMCDDLVRLGESRRCREYPIEILFCGNCITAHQRFQVPKGDLFPTSYHYRARFTGDVLNGMAGLVESCAVRFGPLRGKKILDIGCNDGSLLDFFGQHGAETMGIEPTDACLDAQQKGHSVLKEYFSEAATDAVLALKGRPDFITFTNVFAHIEDLGAVLSALKRLIAAHTIVVIENHYLGAVLEGNQFDTFYHEHPRSYSYSSFVHIANGLGVGILDAEFPARYGGNIRMFLGSSSGIGGGVADDRTQLLRRESRFFDRFVSLRNNVERWRDAKRGALAARIRQHGRLPAKAFPGRAAILMKMLDLDERSISAVYEKPGSLKIGHYVPGTRIPILSDEELFVCVDKTKPLLNLAWHIPQEIHGYLESHGYTGPIIDIIEAGDFEAGHQVAVEHLGC